MSTGRRLAKRSIIGTKVCAPGPDGLWYSGVIQDVKTPPNSQGTVVATVADTAAAAAGQSSCDSSVAKLSADTRYIVRFDFKTQSMQQQQQLLLQGMDASIAGTSKSVIMEARRAAHMHTTPAQTLRRNAMMKEFRESDLVGPGFRSLVGIELQPGQRVFLTYNGRETSGDVVSHDATKDEVVVKITAIGTEEPIELKKRLEELRLLESRRSARLADQDRDTDFARLADMGGDRRRTSHSIEVPLTSSSSSSSAPASTMSHTPPQQNSRKRPQSNSTHDCNGDEETMNECNAALILMKLSHSPKSPKNAEKWLGSSPGSSSASWSSGSSSPPLSDDGHALHTSMALSEASASARMRTTSVSTSDEGIVVDFKEEAPRKKRASKSKFVCTWKGCNFFEHTPDKIERHIRNVHLGYKKPRRSANDDGALSDSDHEEEFYYTEIEDDDDEGKTPSPTSPPTLSHRDMARPPHEDPEYQRQIVGNFKQGRAANYQQLHHNNGKSIHHSNHTHVSNSHHHQQQHQQQQLPHTNSMPTSPLAHHNYTWPSSATPVASAGNAAAPSATSTPTTTHSAQQHHSQQQQQHHQQHQQQQHHSQQQQQHSPSPIIKHAARTNAAAAAAAAPYPSPTYVHHHHHHHQHHNYSSASGANGSGGGGGGGGSPSIIHSNSSANNVLQQLSQQNVTVTAHHSGSGGGATPQSHSHGHQLSAVTITPNYHHPSGGAPTSAAAAAAQGVVRAHQASHSHHQQQHQQQQQQTPPTATAGNIVSTATISHSGTHSHSQQQHGGASAHISPHMGVPSALSGAGAGPTKGTPNSPNRRTRGENKKCRKVYGMDRRDQWCTQCRWKKACSRFGD